MSLLREDGEKMQAVAVKTGYQIETKDGWRLVWSRSLTGGGRISFKTYRPSEFGGGEDGNVVYTYQPDVELKVRLR